MEEIKRSSKESSKSTNHNHHPVPVDEKLLVKLKTPKAVREIEEAGGGEMVAVSPVKINTHFCKFCNKGFWCGKALGGHVSSAHIQAAGEYLKKLKFNNSTKYKKDGSSCFDDRETVCSICGKDFPSRKSLYGHMRSHPNREWRGMKPPKEQGLNVIHNFLQKTLSEDDYGEVEEEEEDEVFAADHDLQVAIFAAAVGGVGADLTESLSSWSKKDKRGRQALNRTMREDKKVRDAADHLLSQNNSDPLHTNSYKVEHKNKRYFTWTDNGNTLHSTNFKVEHKSDCPFNGRAPRVHELVEGGDSASKKKRVDDDQVDLARDIKDFPLKKRRVNTSGSEETGLDESVLDIGKRKAHVEISPLTQSRDIIGLIATSDGITKPAAASLPPLLVKPETEVEMKCRVDNNQKKLNGHDQEISPENFKCRNCDKTFPTPQALGGHMSSHNKFKISIHNTVDGSSPSPFRFPSVDGRNYNRANPVTFQAVENYYGRVADGSKLVENVHICKKCGDPFPTGQALGGHMRCHRSTASVEDHEPVRKQLLFDLNEKPNDEDLHVS